MNKTQETLINQLRNGRHCGDCPYTDTCDDFESCYMDLLAATVIEDLLHQIKRLNEQHAEEIRLYQERVSHWKNRWEETEALFTPSESPYLH